MTPVSQRVRAWTALLAFVGGLSLPFFSAQHLGLDDDSACGQVSLFTGHIRLEFTPDAPPVPRDHCALCHWQRAVGGASPTAPVAAFSNPELNGVRAIPTTRVAGTAAVPHRPSRAPPASVLT